ncbi:hypothetical protein RIF29_33273 [Crotalaria pallida]|uniref:Uncharacterized protein n=1 Tax=Crotalaria pallida TaxID=3830 RepID=A0AAN9E7M3_CROPI
MAKKRGRPPKANHSTPPSSSRKDPSVTRDNEERNTIPFDLLDCEGNETNALDELDDQQTKALIMNIERVREKLKGKKPVDDHANPTNENVGVVHEITYEWKPIFCEQCNSYGHDKKMCKKGTKKVWVVKNKLTQEQVLEVVDSIKLHEAIVNETVPKENLNNNIQLHSIVREGIRKENAVIVEDSDDQWQIVQRKKGHSNKRDKELLLRSPGSPNTPLNG